MCLQEFLRVTIGTCVFVVVVLLLFLFSFLFLLLSFYFCFCFLFVCLFLCMFFGGDSMMITHNDYNNDYISTSLRLQIMRFLLMNINPQKEIVHNYDFSVYTAPKYRDMKLATYTDGVIRRLVSNFRIFFFFFSNFQTFFFFIFKRFISLLNGWQLAKMKKSIPDMFLS